VSRMRRPQPLLRDVELISPYPSQTLPNTHSNFGRNQSPSFDFFPLIHPDNRSSCLSFSTRLSFNLSTRHLGFLPDDSLSLIANFRTSTRSPQLPLYHLGNLRILPSSVTASIERPKSRTSHSLIREIERFILHSSRELSDSLTTLSFSWSFSRPHDDSRFSSFLDSNSRRRNR